MIVLLFEYETLHGGENSLLSVLPLLQQSRRHFVALAPPLGDLTNALRDLGVEVRPFETTGPTGARLPLEQLRARLGELLAELRPRLLHANSLAMSRLSGPVAQALGIRSIGHLRDIVGLNRTAIADLNRHTRLLCVSQATREFHLAQGLDADRTFVLYNGVDTEKFRPRKPLGFLHQELGIPPGTPLIGTVGQISLRKNQAMLLEAFRYLLHEHPFSPWTAGPGGPRAKLLVIGQRWSEKAETVEYEHRLHEMAQEPPLCGRVHFLGTRADMAMIYPELALLAHPAKQEPLGRVLLEAASCGVPIVATNVGGTSEIFSDFSARLVSPSDPEGFADAMQGILGGLTPPALARRIIEQRFCREMTARELDRHYDYLIP